jgi:predicted AlkP superfamily pyrophosphatase or phosphodiesterase
MPPLPKPLTFELDCVGQFQPGNRRSHLKSSIVFLFFDLFPSQFRMRNLLFLAFLALCATATAQTARRPKLIIGIVVDQMRYDYLYRYESAYGEGGFKRLLREGFSCENTHFNYMPTYTGPGHAAIYSGTTPSVNGIIGNDWWDPEWKESRYVTQDKRYQTVGGTPGIVGQHSPAVLLSSTVTDELRLSNAMRSKVLGVCLKDRGSILPAGHFPNAAYWFDDKTGNWITSTYYPDSLALPKWVQDFNNQKRAQAYINKGWEKLKTADYSASFPDWKPFKTTYISGDLPYDLTALQQKFGLGVIRYTPYGNELTLDFALEAIEKMELGNDEFADFLCLSFSSTDYCGHQNGVHAEETEDVYLKLDQQLERLLTYIDKHFGKDQVLVFLTADHGGAETPAHLKSIGGQAGVFAESKTREALSLALEQELGFKGNFIHEVSNQQVWLHWEAITDLEVDPNTIADVVIETLRAMPGVYDAMSVDELMYLPDDYPFVSEVRRGIHPRRSGDIVYLLDPAWHSEDRYFLTGGTTHGSPYAYDTHVPLLWYGWKIPKGESVEPVSITDIAPTLSALLRIMEPNGNTGKIIEDIFED